MKPNSMILTPRARAKTVTRARGRAFMRRNVFWGLFFVSPWLVGLLGLTLYPMALSLYYSFTNYDIIGTTTWVGLQNYQSMFMDTLFWQSLDNTLYLVAFMVPISLLVALVYALLLNVKIPGQGVFRTIFYLPQMMPTVATAMLWVWMLNPQFGLINTVLGWLHIEGPLWLNSLTWSKPSLVIMHTWSVGGAVIIFLAGLQGVSPALLDAARIDGANVWSRFRHVTLPALSPLILFNLVTAVLGAMQYFTQAYVMGGGGNSSAVGIGGSLEFSMIYLFQLAFDELRMGYASAVSWVLFMIMLIFVIILFATSKRWTYYEGWRSRP